ncbi:MAG: hypothetical protein L0154_06190 [Chloroflexi bacterium]|nr:hypothetical protein [Chloroflexota bacterium]
MLNYEKGKWQALTIPEAMGGTLTLTSEPHAYLSVYFEGTGIRIIYAAGPDGNAFTARLDHQPEQTGSAYFTETRYGHPFVLENLTPGTHVLTLYNGPGTLRIEGVQVEGRLTARPPQTRPPSVPDTLTSVNSAVRDIQYIPGGRFVLYDIDDINFVEDVILADIGFPIQFYTTTYTGLYVDINGYVAFDPNYVDLTLEPWVPSDLHETGFPIIATFWEDVVAQGTDPNINIGIIEYGRGTIGSNSAFAVTWREVECFSTTSTTRNTFQMVLINQSSAPNDYILELNYEQIEWESSDGNADCIIDNPNYQGNDIPRAGYSDGSNQSTSVELPGSGVPNAFLDIDPSTGQANPTGLIYNSLDSSVLGRYRWCFGGPCPPEPSVCTITVIEQPTDWTIYVPQEAQDMKAFADGAGLIVHSAPTINAVRGTSSTSALSAISLQDTHIAWGSPIDAVSRIVFPKFSGQVEDGQVWFEINLPNGGTGWILGFIKDYDSIAQAWFDREFVVGGATTCGALGAPIGQIRFYYDREMAANYAIAHSYQNEAYPPENGFVHNRLNDDVLDYWSNNPPIVSELPFAHFHFGGICNYDCSGEATGSAVFTSHVIWMGGMPSTLDLNYDPNNLPAAYECSNPTPTTSRGWRYCAILPNQNKASQGGANNVWNLHQGIIAYYTDTVLPFVTEPDGQDNDNPSDCTGTPTPSDPCVNDVDRPLNIDYANPLDMLGSTRGHAVPTRMPLDDAARYSLTEIRHLTDKIISLSSGKVLDNVMLSNIVTGVVSEIKYGDYMWINTGASTPLDTDDDDTHGLLVVGWGEAKNCADVIEPSSGVRTQLIVGSSTDISPTLGDANTAGVPNPVPYVVDFSFRIQQPIPRPFYCTRFDAEDYTSSFVVTEDDPQGNSTDRNWSVFDFNHSWYFFALPDEIMLDIEFLHVDATWQWLEATDVIVYP